MSHPGHIDDVLREDEPLLPADASPDEMGRVKSGWRRFVPSLDLAPAPRDKAALSLVYVGLAIFLPLVWYYVLSADLKALGWFAVHPTMQSIAMTAVILGITTLQPYPPSPAVRHTRFQSHYALGALVALPTLALGSAAMWYNKHLHGAKHFTTWHGKLGLVAIVWMVAQGVVGAVAHYAGVRGKWMYKWHRLSGYAVVTLVLLTAHLAGGHSDWSLGRKGFAWLRVVVFWIALPVIWVGIVSRIRPTKLFPQLLGS